MYLFLTTIQHKLFLNFHWEFEEENISFAVKNLKDQNPKLDKNLFFLLDCLKIYILTNFNQANHQYFIQFQSYRKLI